MSRTVPRGLLSIKLRNAPQFKQTTINERWRIASLLTPEYNEACLSQIEENKVEGEKWRRGSADSGRIERKLAPKCVSANTRAGPISETVANEH